MLSKEYDCKGVKSKEFNYEDRETWARGLSQVGGVKAKGKAKIIKGCR